MSADAQESWSRRSQPGGRASRRRHRRVVAPPTSGQPEELEAQIGLSAQTEAAIGDGDPSEAEQQGGGAWGEWLRQQRPPHW